MSPNDTPAVSKRDIAHVQAKQIRFVPSDGLPHAKRRRVGAACLTCRKRKTRCTGERPVCKTCIENGHECAGYTAPSRHQGYVPKPGHGTTIEDEDDTESFLPATTGGSLSARIAQQNSRQLDKLPSSPEPSSPSSIASPKTLKRQTSLLPQRPEPDFPDPRSPASSGTNQSSSQRNRVPYFRYFGPTAIVPGFKQMVVRVRQGDPPVTEESPASLAGALPQTRRASPSQTGSEPLPTVEIPFYHANESASVSPLIIHLSEKFFTHLGCNFPFLQRDRFLRDLEEKSVDAILVDAVCALGARFSDHALLATPNAQSIEVDINGQVHRAFRGHPFTQRAMSAVIDTFSYPTISIVQACLLLGYDEFGSNHDSGLWMYLGTSIRMAQDIGMHKLEGLRLEGRVGPTPMTVKRGSEGSSEESEREEHQRNLTRKEVETLQSTYHGDQDVVALEDRRNNERERIDTFYAVFFLDRVVSSGTGRPVTLKDKDIEISFPFWHDDDSVEEWPAPYPPMIRIIHLYGRAADVLNGIKDVDQVTPSTLKRLAALEKDLTGIYQALSPKLHFNAPNFQHYVKAEQGTNFILLHFWFHTLIVLLHQPTLLHSFGGDITQLFPNSRELSTSSAKTIADILAFAELIDAKSFIGSPFTSQPMYIAACAFLAEVARYSSSPPTRGTSPEAEGDHAASNQTRDEPGQGTSTKPKLEKRKSAKNSLLATAANQNYQRCYKSLQALEQCWAGVRYILTALDQKAKGIMDPLLYTNEDIESAIEVPRPRPAFSTPGWRRSLAHRHSFSYPDPLRHHRAGSNMPKAEGVSPRMDASPIGWSLTGGMNSPNPNLSLLYPAPHNDSAQREDLPTTELPSLGQSEIPPPQSRAFYSTQLQVPRNTSSNHSGFPISNTLDQQHVDRISDADLLLGLHSPAGSGGSGANSDAFAALYSSMHNASSSSNNPFGASNVGNTSSQSNVMNLQPNMNIDESPINDMMMIETQDIDFNGSQASAAGFAFPNGDMIPWLEYLPQDVLNYFEGSGTGGENS